MSAYPHCLSVLRYRTETLVPWVLGPSEPQPQWISCLVGASSLHTHGGYDKTLGWWWSCSYEEDSAGLVFHHRGETSVRSTPPFYLLHLLSCCSALMVLPIGSPTVFLVLANWPVLSWIWRKKCTKNMKHFPPFSGLEQQEYFHRTGKTPVWGKEGVTTPTLVEVINWCAGWESTKYHTVH